VHYVPTFRILASVYKHTCSVDRRCEVSVICAVVFVALSSLRVTTLLVRISHWWHCRKCRPAHPGMWGQYSKHYVLVQIL